MLVLSYISFMLHFTQILTSPGMHVPRWPGSLVCDTGHGILNLYHISWHFLEWQPWTNFWTDDLFHLGVHCCCGLVLYVDYLFLQSLSLTQGRCSLPIFLLLVNTHSYRYDLLSCWAYRQENGICHMP